jgi:hypothetical protein
MHSRKQSAPTLAATGITQLGKLDGPGTATTSVTVDDKIASGNVELFDVVDELDELQN